MSYQLQPYDRTLPAGLSHEATIIGYRILRILDRLRLFHENRDGTVLAARFEKAFLFGDKIAAYVVDCERLPLPVDRFADPAVIRHLSAGLHLPVKVDSRSGLTYLVRLSQPDALAAQSLPAHIDLDFDHRPVSPLAVPVGRGSERDVWHTLPEIGHALVVGTSGAGKSVWLHSALAALLTGAGPHQVQVALIDLKRSELPPWSAAPHLWGQIACTESQAGHILNTLVTEADRRGELLAGLGARDIAGYNKRASTPLPYIVCVIDECLDLVLSAGQKSSLTNHIKTLAIRGRSAGVYVWAATQHAAAVDGLPRVVKANLQSRIVFRVLDRVAAEVAGCPGAQHLPRSRPGRLLARVNDEPLELQGYFLSDDSLLAMAAQVAGKSHDYQGLTDCEQKLVQYAMRELRGAFTIGKLATAFGTQGISKYQIEMLGKRWEMRGWLTAPRHATDSRRVTLELAQMAGIGQLSDA